ncbi:type II toxin-antitoxin system VapC family toxin [Desulfonema magnum]|uniref:PIN domain-containing protein n=1 Tax=Desulfonema magnum TaxID=45655 RepID=A0A975GTQ6_9BACT|nr:PIN domain-containing protein [Desulfonema magnum]QTA92383.1 PIN domain-containing protein [Desulfonema magnum]
MKNTLIDAGPLIALFDKSDKFHDIVKKFLSDYFGSLITTWPVITETTHMLDFNVRVQIDFLKWLYKGAIRIASLRDEHLERLIELSEKYSDIPMDLADGSLLVVSELTGIKDIITIDSDYYIYRTKDKRALKNLLEPYIAPLK